MSLTTSRPTVHDALAADVPTASAHLLARACPRYDPALDAWFVADYPTARRLLADRRLRSRDSAHSTADLTDEQRDMVAPLEDHVGRWLVFSDEPRLADLRVRTRRALRPEADPGRAAWLTELARRHRPADLTDSDLLTGHIVPFTTAATLRVLGCDPERDSQLVAWGEELIAYLGLAVYREDVVRRALAALDALRAHVRRWLPTARGPVGGALRAAAGERAAEEDLTAVFTQLLTGGLEPTRTALAVGVDRLCAPGGRAAFLAAPAGFVDEVLRLASPFQWYGIDIREEVRKAAGFAGKEDALRWLDQHRDSLLAAVPLAQEYGLLRHAAHLPRELGFHSSIRSYDTSANLALERGVAVSRQLRDPALLRLNLTNLAMGQWRLGRLRDAVAHLEEALEISQSMADTRSEAECKARLGQAYNSLGDLAPALRLSREANRMARETCFTRLDGSSLSTLSHVLVRLGRFEEACRAAHRALEVFDRIGETPVGGCPRLSLREPARAGPPRRGAVPAGSGPGAVRTHALVGRAVTRPRPAQRRPRRHRPIRRGTGDRRPRARRGHPEYERHPPAHRPPDRRPVLPRVRGPHDGPHAVLGGLRHRLSHGAEVRTGARPGRPGDGAHSPGRFGHGCLVPDGSRTALHRHGRTAQRALARHRGPARVLTASTCDGSAVAVVVESHPVESVADECLRLLRRSASVGLCDAE
ncbi:hypothetical protein CAG99_08075 [Streptomyces marincola]|uniref:Uncharacterized protein n=1 Tax=Streptomyces marincola TaxID=2878388 RepID=A0A1W7CVP4_9ACTN|nr:hypothetical protein CAG99_08075 [Streptomyces marincola]